MPLLLRRQLRSAAAFASTRPCSSKPGQHALLNQGSLILSHGGEQLEGKPAVRLRRVKLHTGQAGKADAAVLQILDDLQQMLQTTPESVELPHHEHIALTAGPEARRHAVARPEA